ncbi:recombinase family protein [Ancylobacter oerskovii]|uniref:Recombinase family protein n=1 Tax=Ancylobacter oerskovii TaxID=459519 RepID=A0ABW4Z5H2_9HYPH|nr:recombinase family protein [Ancylobacter oerskovii]MBS7543021.1 recombinase family protein [Ancylobacter oerskovii]
MAVIGYVRPSSLEQGTALQVETLYKAGCEVIREEKRVGATMAGRKELRTILNFIRAGDVLMVTRLHILAASITSLQDILRELHTKGASLKTIERPIDTSKPTGRMFLDVLEVLYEFEAELLRERRVDSIAKAKSDGSYRGRQPTIDPAAIARLRARGLGPTDIAKKLAISRASVYRLLRSNVT